MLTYWHYRSKAIVKPQSQKAVTKSGDKRLENWRILVVEDEPLTAMDVAMSLENAGAVVLGPAASEMEALHILDQDLADGPLDGAVLDVMLVDHTSERIADRLIELGVPIVLHTANWEPNGDLTQCSTVPVIAKPAALRMLIDALLKTKVDQVREDAAPVEE